jgi:hypothetical protein
MWQTSCATEKSWQTRTWRVLRLRSRRRRCATATSAARTEEVLMLIAGAAAIALLAVFAGLESGVVPGFVGGYSLILVWVVGLRRLVPSHRDATDRLLMVYRAMLCLRRRPGRERTTAFASGRPDGVTEL